MSEARTLERPNDDPDARNALLALQRAAQRARTRAARAGKTVVIFRNGEIIEESPQEQLAADDRTGRAVARALLNDLESPQLELLDDEGER